MTAHPTKNCDVNSAYGTSQAEFDGPGERQAFRTLSSKRIL